jgi:RHS repeat-associated protein
VGGSLAKTAVPTTSASLTYDLAGQLTNNGNQTLTYDAQGNLLQAAGRTYVWDERDQLSAIWDGNSLVAAFTYLPDGRHLSRAVNGVVTQFLYYGSNVLQEQNASGVIRATYMPGFVVDEMSGRVSASGRRLYLRDATGSILATVDPNGNSVARYTYEPYGLSSVAGNAEGDSFGYTGRENDGAGLLYYRARYYDPQLARFISRDPLNAAAGVGAYSYASGDPVSRTDPSGHYAAVMPGYIPIGVPVWAGPVVAAGLAGYAGYQLGTAINNAYGNRAFNWVWNQIEGDDVPPLPEDYVGDNPTADSGKGKRKNSSAPAERFPELIEELTNWKVKDGTGKSEGQKICPNGVRVRPDTGEGTRIDVPKVHEDHERMHETIHFPPGTPWPWK